MLDMLKKNKKYAIIIAVILLPLCYSFFYLYAFWDPYSHLKDLPVAVVNSDMGAIINGSSRNVGNEIISKLKTDTNLKWIVTNKEDAKDGVSNRRYYAEILIPENYSQKLSTVDKNDKEQGLIYYQPEEKRNYLASQVMNRVMLELKDNISRNITKEIVGNIISEMKRVPEDLTKLNDGVSKLHDGSLTLSGSMNLLDGGFSELIGKSSDLRNGSKVLSYGISIFSNKLMEGSKQVEQLQAGSEKFSKGMEEAGKGSEKVVKAITAIKTGSEDLYNGTAQYSKKLEDFTSAVGAYVDSISASKQADKAVAQNLKSFLAAHPDALQDGNMKSIVSILEKLNGNEEKLTLASTQIKASAALLTQGTKSLEAGSKNLSNGIDQFEKSASELPKGITQLAASYNQINEGIGKVNASVETAAANSKVLRDGITKLDSGIIAYTAGAGKVNDGAKKILEGTSKIESSLKEVNQSVADAAVIANKKVSGLNGLDAYAAEPVKMVQNNIDPVPDYGTAFAPYFVSLSLWVGALLLFIGVYLDPFVKFKLLSKGSNKVKRFISYLAISTIQSGLLALVLKKGLKLTTQNTLLFYLTVVLISLSFMMIVQFLMINLKEVGKFLTLLLLILQLTSCGGTFPMELVPGFFKGINAFMPMTYSVNILKEVISGIDFAFLIKNILILSGIGFLCLLVSIILAKFNKLTDTQEPENLQTLNNLV